MTELETALAEAAATFEQLSVAYMLIGGLAVSAWGEPRSTLDIDVSVWVEPEELGRTVERLCRHFRCPREPLAFVERTRVLPVVTAAGIRLDIVFAQLSEEKRMIARSRTKQIGDATVRVAAVEDLVLMKLISERPQDIEDARRLLRRFRKTLDRDSLEPRLMELAEALARPGILGIFRAEVKGPQ